MFKDPTTADYLRDLLKQSYAKAGFPIEAEDNEVIDLASHAAASAFDTVFRVCAALPHPDSRAAVLLSLAALGQVATSLSESAAKALLKK